MCTNTDTLNNKLELLQELLFSESIDVVAISETHYKNANEEEKTTTKFVIPGYQCLQNDSGRGVCLFIKNCYKISTNPEYESIFNPSIFCKITTESNENFTIGVIYRSPNLSRQEALSINNLIDTVSNDFKNSNDKLVIVGDLNYKQIDWNNESCDTSDEHIASKFFNCTQKNFLFQHVKHPTHFMPNAIPSLIDIVLSNDPDFVEDLTHHDPLGASHHSVLLFNIKCYKNADKPVFKERLCMNKGDFQGMREAANDLKLDLIFDDDKKSVDKCWEELESAYTHLTDKFIPKMTFNKNKVVRTFKAPESLLHSLQLKRKAFKYYKKFPTKENYSSYTFYRNQVTREVKKAKRLKEIDLAKKSKTNPKLVYQYISSKTKNKDNIPDLDTPDGDTTKSDTEKAKVLNNFFGSVFNVEDNSEIPNCDFISDTHINNIEITNDDVFKVLKSLKVNKSPGPDGVHPKVLSELAQELCSPLKKLFDKTMREGKIPNKWKLAEVRPIFKKGNKSSPNNYRPVSLTCIVCKVFEHFVRNTIYNHLVDNNMLALEQFGFCQGRSCTTQLLVTINDWFLNLDKNIPVDSVYLDFSKAFDCVPHRRLMSKLYAYGIRGQIFNWIQDFLSDRYQYVSINNCNSDMLNVTSGVPQGSVLGPTLFVYFINDLPKVAQNIVKIFADDTKLYSKIKSEEDCLNLQDDINTLVKWSEKWMMKFNSDKCKMLHL